MEKRKVKQNETKEKAQERKNGSSWRIPLMEKISSMATEIHQKFHHLWKKKGIYPDLAGQADNL